MQKKHLIIIFFLACVQWSRAQENGFQVRNYLPSEYNGYSQMWQAAQDKNGLLFFGCTSNIFIYDGSAWERVPVKSGTATRQVVYDTLTGTIYCGAVEDFGYLQRAFNGEWKYVSLVEKVPEKYRVFSDIWKIHIINGNVYFQASERIFIFRDGKFKGVIEGGDNGGFALSFRCGNRMFVRKRNVGLMEVVDDHLRALPGGGNYASTPLLGMLPWKNDSALVLSGDSGFTMMALRPGAGAVSYFSKFPLPADDFLLHSAVLGTKWISDSTFIVFSRSGIGFYGYDGKLRQVINKESGLSDESVSEVLVDRERNLWAMTNFGLSRIYYDRRVSYYDHSTGITGSFEYLLHSGNTMYAGSLDGSWIMTPADLPAGGKMHFNHLREHKTECWAIEKYGDDVLLSTGEGVFRANGTRVEQLTDHNTSLLTFSQKPGEFITAEYGGLTYVAMEPGKPPSKKVFFELPSEELLHISPADTVPGEPGKRDFWCGDRFFNLFHLQINIETGKLEYTKYDTTTGAPAHTVFPVRLGDSTYFLGYNDCYRYIPSKDHGGNAVCFEKAPDMFRHFFSGDISGLRGPFNFRLFLYHNQAQDSIAVFGRNNDGTIFREKLTPGELASNTIEYACAEPGGPVWFLTLDKMLRVNPKKKNNSDISFSAFIRRVSIGKDSVVFAGSDSLNNTFTTELPYRFNSISFRFAAPFFDHEDKLKYSYKLNGYDTAWADWNDATMKDYMNLHEGTYTFRVKALNIFNRESSIASFTFTILPPWYRTAWAYFFYFILFAGILLLSARLASRRLRKQKEKLEMLVNERTAEVVKQKQQIEQQKLELETAYTDIKDSIHYAQRIQKAILPEQEDIRRMLPESFIFFRPRDIVSGDFSWFASRGNKSYIACVDCTGHGVPGALMSMIGNTLLSQIVMEKKIESPGEVLNMLHAGVRHALRQDTGGETRDGMDIALCMIDHNAGTLSYAGANRPLWYVQMGTFHEIKADKFPIAGDQMEEERLFTTHTLRLQPGDTVYLSTDGFADQFGGSKGKKFMVKRFQQLLFDIHHLPVAEQEKELENAFSEWKGELEQVDDVLVIGFRMSATT